MRAVLETPIPTLLRADFSRAEVVDTNTLPWVDSPAMGVQRKLIERDGGEAARATSLVRYAPGARFAEHHHPLGEEILVLAGTFADEHGVYPTGTYLKNPPDSSHAPFTEQGCTLLVKLRHMQPDDRQRVRIQTHQAPWIPVLVQGLRVKPLSDHAGEHTALVQWTPGTVFTPHRHWGGEEIYVIEGIFEDEHGRYPAGTWMRSPHLSQHAPFSTQGCTIFVKVGHLPEQG
jgi:anti-sigma factor ChrR (cupin superfamily)